MNELNESCPCVVTSGGCRIDNPKSLVIEAEDNGGLFTHYGDGRPFRWDTDVKIVLGAVSADRISEWMCTKLRREKSPSWADFDVAVKEAVRRELIAAGVVKEDPKPELPEKSKSTREAVEAVIGLLEKAHSLSLRYENGVETVARQAMIAKALSAYKQYEAFMLRKEVE